MAIRSRPCVCPCPRTAAGPPGARRPISPNVSGCHPATAHQQPGLPWRPLHPPSPSRPRTSSSMRMSSSREARPPPPPGSRSWLHNPVNVRVLSLAIPRLCESPPTRTYCPLQRVATWQAAPRGNGTSTSCKKTAVITSVAVDVLRRANRGVLAWLLRGRPSPCSPPPWAWRMKRLEVHLAATSSRLSRACAS